MQLDDLLSELPPLLGTSLAIRRDHNFLVPIRGGLARGGLAIRTASAVIFSSPIPSAKTALIAFAEDAENGSLADFAFLGAPFVFLIGPQTIRLYEFRGSPLPLPVGETTGSAAELATWVRGRLQRLGDATQLSLSFGTTRDLLIGQTTRALAVAIKSLMTQKAEEGVTDPAQAFSAAIQDVRKELFSTRASRHPWLRFPNVPLEAFAELYETLALEEHTRRRLGIVYTPAWLAKFVVSRLPANAFSVGRALDPTCGSGTFLVAFLEQVVERASSVNDIDRASHVRGVDIDPVAVETARLALDFFARSLQRPPLTWDLRIGDATRRVPSADWIIGNLPFGHRSYEGRLDVSGVILEKVLRSNHSLRGLSLVLPDSIAYTRSAAAVRALARQTLTIDEITRLPEDTFESSNACTLVLSGRRGVTGQSLLVREVEPKNLPSFRAGVYVARSFGSRLPDAPTEPWVFSPLSNEFDRAEHSGLPLKEVANIWMGLQIYGTEETSLAGTGPGYPLLADPQHFARWSSTTVRELPRLHGDKSSVRRPGPWDLFPHPKLIIRATTSTGSKDRLAAIADRQGLWFTDKFVGIWPLEDPKLEGIAAYLQTRFARAWFAANNPSRKLRVRVLELLPVPRLSNQWWALAADLASSNTLVKPSTTASLFLQARDISAEWTRFNQVVEASLELSPSVGDALEKAVGVAE